MVRSTAVMMSGRAHKRQKVRDHAMVLLARYFILGFVCRNQQQHYRHLKGAAHPLMLERAPVRRQSRAAAVRAVMALIDADLAQVRVTSARTSGPQLMSCLNNPEPPGFDGQCDLPCRSGSVDDLGNVRDCVARERRMSGE